MPAAPRASAAPEGRGTRNEEGGDEGREEGPEAGCGTGAVVALLLSRNSLVLLDLSQVALARVEEGIVDGGPSAQLVDCEEAGRRRILRLVHERRLHGPVALARVDLLRF